MRVGREVRSYAHFRFFVYMLCCWTLFGTVTGCSPVITDPPDGLVFCTQVADCKEAGADFVCILNICQKKQACQPKAEECNGRDDDCDGQVDNGNPGGGVDCVVSEAKGPCREGKTTCSGGKISCTQTVKPVTEICGNGVDDDCDGTIDKAATCGCPKAGATEACYTGDAKTRSVGSCKDGQRTCQPNQEWGPCVGEIKPSAEVCDGKDNNCDGKVDEGNPDAGQACQVPGQKGPCARGVSACTGGKITCPQQVQPAAKEACGNNIDDNCNGEIDESPPCTCKPGSTRPCYDKPLGCKVGKDGKFQCDGVCKPGSQSCSGAQTWSRCEGLIVPSAEVCDGKDNDCNGKVDDGNPNAGRVCQVKGQKGPCASGVDACVGGKVVCQQQVKPKAKEICGNGIDDNCNGTVDEQPPCSCKVGTSRPCYNNPIGCKSDGNNPPKFTCVGSCGSGTQFCAAGQKWSACLGTKEPQTEVCDGKDNDCNGQVDDKVAGTGIACSVPGAKGACERGVIACVKSKVSCTQTVKPAPETCNGIDDDCNGSIDDGLRRNCYGGPSGTPGKGICKLGTQTCSAGAWGACTGEVRPAKETCNGTDDDCDGKIDEKDGAGDVKLTQSCYSGSPGSSLGKGPCKGGTQSCTNGAYGGPCVGEVVPKTETCNKVDDDCDGTVDEGGVCVTQPVGCASGTNDQVFAANMVGCDCSGAGCKLKVKDASALCASGWKACSLSQWKSRRGTATSAKQRYVTGTVQCNFLSLCPGNANAIRFSLNDAATAFCKAETSCDYGSVQYRHVLMVGPTIADGCGAWQGWSTVSSAGNVGRGASITKGTPGYSTETACLDSTDGTGVVCCK